MEWGGVGVGFGGVHGCGVVAHGQVLNIPNELRSPRLLVADGFLAAVVAGGFEWQGGR